MKQCRLRNVLRSWNPKLATTEGVLWKKPNDQNMMKMFTRAELRSAHWWCSMEWPISCPTTALGWVRV